MQHAFINGDVFDGESLRHQHALLVDNGIVTALVPMTQLPDGVAVREDLQGKLLVPGFIDLQVNGGGGVLLNNDPSLAGIKRIAEAHRTFGTTGLLPTLITDDADTMQQAIAAVQQAIDSQLPGILGIHLEGPYLSPAKKGAHDANKFTTLDEQGLELLSSLRGGVTLVTLAPECTDPAMIRRLRERGIIVSAGHSNADFQQTQDALAAGVQGFTHLYNAMTPLQSRAPGMVGAALADKHSWFGIIADGHHMHPAAFQVAVAAKTTGKALLVTDAMATVGAQDKIFTLDGETIRAASGRCMNAAGSLAGSDLDMITAVNNAARFADIDWFEAIRMASRYPAAALGLDDRLGFLRPGYRADFNIIDSQRRICRSYIAGRA